MNKTQISIISIGDELLKGRISNTHLQYMGAELLKCGIIPKLQITAKDTIEDIQKSLEFCLSDTEICVITGGLGPTTDDLTVKAVSEFFGLKIIQNRSVLEELKLFLKLRGRNTISDANLKQTYVPENSEVISNPNGTAPGIKLRIDTKTLFLLPGPPSEMIPMFEKHVLPFIKVESNLKIFYQSIYAIGVPESDFQQNVSELLKQDYKKFDIAFRAKPGICELMISGQNEVLVDNAAAKIKNFYNDSMLSNNFTHPVEEICNIFKIKKWFLATAESCTGGMIAASITDISGVSSFFKGGFVVYSNELKQNLLDVSYETLKEYGAVSAETAKEMLIGLCRNLKVDAGIVTTGIAGPDGGSEEKPVGLVYIGIKLFDKVLIKKYNFHGNRDIIRKRTVITALDQLRKLCYEF